MAKKQQKGVITLLQQQQPSQAQQDVSAWKSAIRAFDSITNPVRSRLYDLYESILLDGQVEATWGKRRDYALNRGLVFTRDGETDETVTALLNSPDMRLVVREIHNTAGYGYTLLQFNDIWYDDDQECYRIDFDLIPRAHVHPEPGFECISRERSSLSRDWLYMQPPMAKYMLWAGDPKDKGLFVKVAPYVIYKRGAQGDWSQFSEMFGMPFREAIYDAFDDATRLKIQEMLNNWSAGMSAVHPKGVEIKLHPTGGSTGSADVYKAFIEQCDAGISKTILGNTLTTEQGEKGARSLGEVHAAGESNKYLSDEKMILDVLNTRFRSILKTFGIDVAGGVIAYETPGCDWTAMETKWRVISGVAGRVPVADDYIYEEFNIPKPGNYDQLKEEMRSRQQAALPVAGEQLTAGEPDFFA